MRMIYTRHSFDGHTSCAAPTCIFLMDGKKEGYVSAGGINKFIIRLE